MILFSIGYNVRFFQILPDCQHIRDAGRPLTLVLRKRCMDPGQILWEAIRHIPRT